MENNQRNSRKRLNSLILLVAFTAVMLIVSTYAWFSAQKNVSLSGLKGIVKVAEGLEISLDAYHWSQEVDFEDYTQEELKKMYGVTSAGEVTEHTRDGGDLDASDVEHNIIPTELLPVSTTGKSNDGIGLTDMNMYRGVVSTDDNKSSLADVITVLKNTTGYTTDPAIDTPNTVVSAAHRDYPGYYAIDFFLKNSTSTTDAGTTNYDEILQLNTNSKLELLSASSLGTGLQNTVRVAFAMFEADGIVAPDGSDDGDSAGDDLDWTEHLADTDTTDSNHMSASQLQILNAYQGKNIRDVAIWEPNASDHVDYIMNNVVQYNTYPKFSKADTILYIDPTYGDKVGAVTTGVSGLSGKYTNTSVTPNADVEYAVGAMRTYALTSTAAWSANAEGATDVTDIYDWATPTTGLASQVTLQTEKVSSSDYKIAGGVKNLVSVTSPDTTKYVRGDESGVVNLKMGDGTVCKVRMYVWLEGQDVDTINHASHGGGIYLDLGLLKDGTVGAS